jgi:ABC-type transporter MlaC component
LADLSTAIRRTLAAITCFAAVIAFTLFSEAATCPGGKAVTKAASDFIGAARDGSASAFAVALTRHADVDAVALFALGKYRNELPAARHREYVRNAHRYMSRFLADHARRFRGGSELKIESCKGNLIETSLDGKSGIVWRVSRGRIQDVRIGGVWLAIQLRSKFTGIIQRARGDVTALFDFLARGTGADRITRKTEIASVYHLEHWAILGE